MVLFVASQLKLNSNLDSSHEVRPAILFVW